ncbi:MAG: DUF5320 domain-containing protein [Promethearchaeota archaeon]
MPGGDRTGPAGLGSRTGRGLGYCAGYDTPGFTKGPGGGGAWGAGRRGYNTYGRGLAWGRGARWWGGGGYFRGGRAGIFFNAPIYPVPPELTEEQKLEALKQDKEYLESELTAIQNALKDVSKRIEDLEK